jgi:hypothetical protein
VRIVNMIVLLSAASLLVPASSAASSIDLSWDGPLTDGTLVRVHAIFDEGPPGAPGMVSLGFSPEDQGLTRSTDHQADAAPPEPHTLLAFLGDAEDVDICTLYVEQGIVTRDGLDGIFTARLGPFNPTDTVTVFFTWDTSVDAPHVKVSAVYLGEGRQPPVRTADSETKDRQEPDEPGRPGRPQIRSTD